MALERAIVTWDDGEPYYFLSPDGEEWLEVTAESYHRAPEHEADAVADLRRKLAGEKHPDGSMTLPLRFARRFIQFQGQRPGFKLAMS